MNLMIGIVLIARQLDNLINSLLMHTYKKICLLSGLQNTYLKKRNCSITFELLTASKPHEHLFADFV
jgi:hypothetical protein